MDRAANEIGVNAMTVYRWIHADPPKIIFVVFGDLLFIPLVEVDRQKRLKNQSNHPESVKVA